MHDPCEESTDRMLLPAGGFHDGGNCRTLRPAQQADDFGLLGIRPRLGLGGILLVEVAETRPMMPSTGPSL